MSNQSPDHSQYQYPEGTAGSQPHYQFGQSSAASGGQASPYAANGSGQQPSASGYGSSPYSSAAQYSSAAPYGSPYAYNYGAQRPPQPSGYYGQGYSGAYQPGVYGVPPQVQEENTIGTIALILSLGGIGGFFIPLVSLVSWLALAAGFVMGIVAVAQPNKKKLTGILAIIFSVIGIVLTIFLMMLGFWLISLDEFTLEQDSSSDFYSSVSVSAEGSGAAFNAT